MKIKLLIACVAFSLSCSANSNTSSVPTANQNTGSTVVTNKETSKNETANVAKNAETAAKKDTYTCPSVQRAGKRQIKTQTFPFDFKPFEKSCFVTFASTEDMMDEKDVPRGSTFHIYQNGKSVFDLPDAFDGLTGCWIEGASFKDLNADGLTDIVIAGSCLGAKSGYPANAIFVNNGKDFTTNGEANQKLENFKKLSEIEAFVKNNQKLFF